MKYLDNKGDTIVEVLMAMAVLGLVLAGSFNIANRSLLVARQAQERSEALKYTESQIEKIRTLASANFTQLTQTSLFCLDDTLTPRLFAFSTLPALGSFNSTPYSANGCQTGLYNYSIDYERGSGPIAQDMFIVTTRWNRVGGGPNEELVLRYKVHP